MEDELNIAIGTDAFYPTTDGVCRVAQSYVTLLNNNHCKATIITPKNPNQRDNEFPFEIFRYKSWYFPSKEGYSYGWPFKDELSYKVIRKNFDLLHSHCPLATSYYFRLVNRKKRIPVILTYHTKYEYDIEKRVPFEKARNFAYRFILNNIKSADEIWVPSKGTAESLKKIGYDGDFVVMPNGCDMPKVNYTKEEKDAFCKKIGIDNSVPTIIYVGRMIWYKNLKIILDSSKALKDKGKKFNLILLGFGADERAIKKYYKSLGLEDRVIWTGKVSDRDEVQKYYGISDLLVFPSIFDTNGLVVREAASCATPSLLVSGSCAAEGITDNETGFLCEESEESLENKLLEIMENKELLTSVGKNAQEEIYLSWDNAVEKAYERYKIVVENFKKNKEDKKFFNY